MSSLILLTVIVPLALGLAAGLVEQRLHRPALVIWAVAALVIAALYILLEGVPPFPPVSSKHKLGYVILAALLLAPFAPKPGQSVRGLATILLLGAGLVWMGSNKLLAASAWPGSLWMVPLPILLGLGVSLLAQARPEPDNIFVPRLTLLLTAIAGAVVALIGGFVGLAQLQGALAAAIGGSLIVAYLVLLAGRSRLGAADFRAAHWMIGAALSAMILITACFAPSPDPVALYIVALTLFAPLVLPALPKANAVLRPVLFGIAAAIPAIAAIAVSYWNGASHFVL